MKIEGLLIDLDGVLIKNSSFNIFNDVPVFIEYLHKNNIPFKITTNNSRIPPSEIARKLKERGVDINEKDIVSPLFVAPEVLKKEGITKVYIIGSEELKNYFSEKGFSVEENEEVDCVLIGMDKKLNFDKLKIATTALKRNNARLFALNKNLISQDDDGKLFPGVGSIAQMLAYTCNINFEHFGKISRLYNETIFKSINIPPEKLAIISDDLYIDLKGYKSLGLKTIFITTGKYTIDDIGEYKPDYIFNSLTEIMEFMGTD
ncbi:HAD-IIA family hydrolase [Persephonella sp.]